MKSHGWNIIGICLSTAVLAGCELFVFGSKQPAAIEVSQTTSVGAVLLFKAELDSSNTTAATEILAGKQGEKLLAAEKYDMSDEIARISRLITQKPISKIQTDTLSPAAHTIHVEFNYLKKISFSTAKIGNSWYITEIHE